MDASLQDQLHRKGGARNRLIRLRPIYCRSSAVEAKLSQEIVVLVSFMFLRSGKFLLPGLNIGGHGGSCCMMILCLFRVNVKVTGHSAQKVVFERLDMLCFCMEIGASPKFFEIHGVCVALGETETWCVLRSSVCRIFTWFLRCYRPPIT